MRSRTTVVLALGIVAVLGASAVGVGVPTMNGSDQADGDSRPSLEQELPESSTHRTDTACSNGTLGAPDGTGASSSARIVSLLANPSIDGDDGEFVVVSVSHPTNVSDWVLTDGHTEATFPSETVEGRVVASTVPERARTLTDLPIVPLAGHLRLADDGDAVELRANGRTVDAVEYDHAPAESIWYRTDSVSDRSGTATDRSDERATGAWWPRGATCLPVTSAAPGTVTTFVLPDSPSIPLETLRSAEDRLLLAGYTFTSEAVAAELAAAARRGVDVRVLLEAGPVGGTPDATVPVLDRLEAAGVSVRVVGGPGGRYAYHHAKYAVVDDRALVTTENWKRAGIGGGASRGWGVAIADADVAADLAAVFAADFHGRDATPWPRHRAETTFVESDRSGGEFPARTDPETVAVDRVELLLAPDNAEPRLVELLEDADDRILVQQMRIDGTGNPLLAATLSAARRGVAVEILLDDSWYVRDENRALEHRLERVAAAEDIPLEVRLVEPDGFEKIHAKGVVIDDTVVLGSANWNANAVRENREVVVAIHGREAAAYYAAVFRSDWRGESWQLPVGLGAVLVVALVGAVAVGRRTIDFRRGVPGSDATNPSDE